MKNTRKFMAAVMALAMVSAISPMAAFADTTVTPDPDNMPNPKPGTAGMDVSYTYTSSTSPAPTYTVTIPAGVTLSDSAAVEKSITAESVTNMEATGKKIVVTLDSASNNATGDSTFKAKNGDSEATYTISSGETAVKVGDTVAEFTANGSSTLTFSKITLPASPVDGDYTETLTFGITLESQAIRFATPGRGETTYVTIPGASAETPVYFTGAYTGSVTTETVAYSHGTAGSYDVLHFNGTQIYHGDWNVGSALEITGGSGTETDPYVLTRV